MNSKIKLSSLFDVKTQLGSFPTTAESLSNLFVCWSFKLSIYTQRGFLNKWKAFYFFPIATVLEHEHDTILDDERNAFNEQARVGAKKLIRTGMETFFSRR